MSAWENTPDTHLHSPRNTSVTSSASASTLSMTDEEMQAAAEREAKRPPFGFARVLKEEP